jgi:hypothetical protein
MVIERAQNYLDLNGMKSKFQRENQQREEAAVKK